ncbi:hypothetical protein DYB34_003938 [Aphanomyces astaci]|uniref:RNase H type-1 domain-containing protein n=2 Tax=Aphanomyces astaci TaxID=112090 RepID=A0A3R6W479_APHAT|nr:hypothetical protein DYB34_003938 [Aphanomyces astaci]
MAWRRTTLDTKLGSSSARSPSDTSGMTAVLHITTTLHASPPLGTFPIFLQAQFEALSSYRTRRRHHLRGELYQILILQCRRFLAALFSPPRDPTPLRMEGMVFFDGAARLDPACGGSGALVLAREFPLLCDYDAHYLPMATTNNQAEYDGLVRGLTLARTQGYTHLTIYGDSQLLVRQMIGVYRVHHPGLWSTYLQARLLAAQLKCSWRHRPREGNQAADFLSKLAPYDRASYTSLSGPQCNPIPPSQKAPHSINVTWISIPGQPKIKRAPGEGEGTERRGRKPNPYRSQVTMFLLNNKNANPNDCYQWLLQNYVNPDLPQPDLKQIKTLINNIKSNPNFRSQAMY